MNGWEDSYLYFTEWRQLHLLLAEGDGTFFITSIDDRIYSARFNSYGSCGVGSTEEKLTEFTAITFPPSATNQRIDEMISGC